MASRRNLFIAVILEIMMIQSLGLSQNQGTPAPQQTPTPQPVLTQAGRQATEPPIIKKLGDNLVQINNILVDTKKKEVSVTGHSMSDRILEFVAATKRGLKLYESAIELDTDAVSFNFALIMIGLDRSHGTAPQRSDAQAVGDPVEIWVEWGAGESKRRIRVEEMLYDEKNQRVPKMGQWVYTGSIVYHDGRYLADMDGVLIGFVHDPSPLIENSMGSGSDSYGTIRLNPNLNLLPNTELRLTVKPLPK